MVIKGSKTVFAGKFILKGPAFLTSKVHEKLLDGGHLSGLLSGTLLLNAAVSSSVSCISLHLSH